eukprot:TRINITY_DN5913_c0_g1_i1.p1 TRINITY_DN5913_c0_g1~~TRINITY_DN5913_c0_g1_i1.p1  ORF type:complete len:262 (+),score=92.86 TRINITY_DN5913_c0_g1_i1:409-1194(+)
MRIGNDKKFEKRKRKAERDFIQHNTTHHSIRSNFIKMQETRQEETMQEEFSSSESDDEMETEEPKRFAPLSENNNKSANAKVETRKVIIPLHRMTPLKDNWTKIYTPLVEHMKLQVRVNPRSKKLELRLSDQTPAVGYLQKGVDFVQAFMLGFEVDDAVALLRIDDLFVESFDVEDVKSLKGEHLSRAIGRIAGTDGKTKFTIENVTKTRIVLADRKIHILGSFGNIRIARDAVCDLILGSPPGKVYAKLRTVASRSKERF